MSGPLYVMYGDILVNVSAVLKSLYLLAIFVRLQSINSERGHIYLTIFLLFKL